MDLPPDYRKPTTIAEAETALTKRRASTRESANNAAGVYAIVLTAHVVAEVQAEFDLLSVVMEEYARSSKAAAEQIAAAATVTADATRDAANATLKAALAQEKAATAAERAVRQARNGVWVAIVLVVLTAIGTVIAGKALRQPPPVNHFAPTINVPQGAAPVVNVQPAPVTISPAPATVPAKWRK